MIADREHFCAVRLVARDALHFLGERRAGEAPGGSLSQRDAHRFGITQSLRAQCSQRGFRGIIEGEFDSLPEQAFYMVGPIEQAVERAREMHAEPAGAAA